MHDILRMYLINIISALQRSGSFALPESVHCYIFMTCSAIYGNMDYNTAVMHKCLVILTLVPRSSGAHAAVQHRGGHGAGPHVRARRGGGRLLL